MSPPVRVARPLHRLEVRSCEVTEQEPAGAVPEAAALGAHVGGGRLATVPGLPVGARSWRGTKGAGSDKGKGVPGALFVWLPASLGTLKRRAGVLRAAISLPVMTDVLLQAELSKPLHPPPFSNGRFLVAL